MARVLVVDDQAHVRKALEVLFSLRGIDVCSAPDPAAALSIIEGGDIAVVVQDMNFTHATTTGEEGAALFREIRQLDGHMPVVLMTAWTSLELAVELVREGAADYIAKPWDDESLLRTVRNLLRARELTREEVPEQAFGLVCESAQMKAVLKLATKVARSDVPVLVTGANGSGKERVAEIIVAASNRAEAPFVKVNVGALPDDLLEAELFGSEVGAFTGAKKREGRFEAADGGTLFLDELGNLSMRGQAKLLRVLQTGELQRLGSNETRKVDTRIVAATNVDMKQAIAEGHFREDLYYRLAVIEIALPSLADRIDDILPLARVFLTRYGEEPVPQLSESAVDALLEHDWPGNVRELENSVRRALLVCDGSTIEAADLGLESRPRSSTTPEPDLDPEAKSERDRIEKALVDADYVVSQAAASLGLSRQALYRRMRRLGVSVRRRINS